MSCLLKKLNTIIDYQYFTFQLLEIKNNTIHIKTVDILS
jgi:hypothetical protein